MVKYSHEVRRGDFDGGVSRFLRFCGGAGRRAVVAGVGWRRSRMELGSLVNHIARAIQFRIAFFY